jgi:hypothetical protein
VGLDGLFFKSFINSFRRVDLVPMGTSCPVCSLVAVWSMLFGHYVLSLILIQSILQQPIHPHVWSVPYTIGGMRFHTILKKVLYGCNIIFFFTTFFTFIIFYYFTLLTFLPFLFKAHTCMVSPIPYRPISLVLHFGPPTCI